MKQQISLLKLLDFHCCLQKTVVCNSLCNSPTLYIAIFISTGRIVYIQLYSSNEVMLWFMVYGPPTKLLALQSRDISYLGYCTATINSF
nr:hypothetical protein Iba_chr11cCG3230 [Ipomoea batatas]GMD58335.1 hypothetical protein Iba_chr11fCG4590 [Ipomoea batatas]